MQNAIYLRKSRADQGTVEDTLRKHKETLLDYAAKHNIFVSLNDIYEEVISGESLYARPQMLRLLSDVEAGKFSSVLCMDIDRLGRGGMSDQGIILDTFKSSNTKIITPAKTYDLNDELDENNMEFAAFIARFEYKQIRKRMRAGVKKKHTGRLLPCKRALRICKYYGKQARNACHPARGGRICAADI